MKHIVAVLRGGPSKQYAQSLETGGYVIKHLPEQYSARDIFISSDGVWHADGFPVKPHQALDRVDIVWNALLGEYGEDGKVQRILENSGLPYTGSGPVASALSMNKKMAKKAYADQGLRTPSHVIVEEGDDLMEHAKNIFFHFSMPVVIKPASSGNSHGVSIATSRGEIVPYLEAALKISPTVLVEAFIPGKDIVAVVVENMRNEAHYVPIPIEVRYMTKQDILTSEMKADKEARNREGLHLSEEIKAEIARVARLAHTALGLDHYSRSDMRLTPTGRVYLLETNSVPVLHDYSPTVQSLRSVGIEPSMFIEHMINQAKSRN